MACVVGYGAYRTVVVDHAVPVRLVGPDGRQHVMLSRGLSAIWSDHSVEIAKRWVSKFVWTLNVAYERMPDVADRYEAGLGPAREAQDAFVSAMKINTTASRPYDGSMWLHPKKGDWNKVSDGLIAMAKVTEALSDELYGGEDPSKVDLSLSRMLRKPAKESRSKEDKRVDVDRRLRLGANPAIAPRYDDPRLHERWSAGLKKIDSPEVFDRIMDFGRFAGARAFQALSLSLFDSFASGEENLVKAPNKGSKAERTMEFMLPESRWEQLLQWVGSTRAELSGMSLVEIRRMAGIPAEAALLKSMPLFTEDGVNSIKYPRLYRVMNAAAVAAGLFICDDEYRATGVKRYPGFHYQRHEYVHRRMDEIEALPEAERPAARRALIRYMRWSDGEAMLAWYSAHHAIKVSRAAARAHNEKTDQALVTGTIDRPEAFVSSSRNAARSKLAGLV